MKLSVVIPCLNAADTIATQLESLASQNWSEPWEIVVSDNGSTDGSLTVVEQFKERLPNLRVVDSSDLPWRSHACNVGAIVAIGEAVVFIDADDEVGAGWVAAIGEALSTHDFVACRIDFERLNAPWQANLFGSHPQKTGLQRSWYPPYLPFAGGGTLGVKKSLHSAIGGFDEGLLRLQDVDYCFRMHRKGIALHFVPDALIHLRCRDRLDAIFRQSRLWAMYNVLMYKRYRQPGMKYPHAWREYAKDCGQLLRWFPQIRSREDWSSWLWQFAWQLGLLQGSVKFLVSPVPYRPAPIYEDEALTPVAGICKTRVNSW